MESISYDKSCNSNKDCDSKVCELIYENDKPKGRYCLMDTNKKYTKKCYTNKDCMSGQCKPIYDLNDNFVTRKCVKAPKIDRDTTYNAIFGKDRSNNEYGLLNSNTIAIQAGERGPITEIIITIFSILGNLFNILVFNTDVCGQNRRAAESKCGDPNVKINQWGQCGDSPYEKRITECNAMTERPNQGLLYGIFLSIFDLIFGGIMGNVKYGFIWGGFQKKHYNTKSHKCDKINSAKGFDLWYVRSILTVLFPPFGVFMAKGLKGIKQLIICSILTMFFYFPGLIYALGVINSTDKEQKESDIIKEMNVI